MIVTDRQPRLTHEVIIHAKSNVDVERMCSWCHKQFGMRFSIVDRETFGRDGVWQCIAGTLRYHSDIYSYLKYTFSFDHEQDAVVFALRWA
jgi:hypothetical protein